MIKRNFCKNLLDINGNIIKDTENVILTYKNLIVNALVTAFESDKDLSGEDKLKRLNLAENINNKKDEYTTLTAEEVVLIKQLVNKAYSTLVVGRIFNFLENEDK